MCRDLGARCAGEYTNIILHANNSNAVLGEAFDFPDVILRHSLHQTNAMRRQKITVRICVERDGNGFYAYAPTLKGLHVGGDTEEEVLKNVEDGIILYLDSLSSVCPENACAPGLFRDIGVHFGSIRLIIGGAVVFETLVCAGFFCITGISYLLDTPLASARTSHLMFFLG